MLAGFACHADAQQVPLPIANGSHWSIQARTNATATASIQAQANATVAVPQDDIMVDLDNLSLAAAHGADYEDSPFASPNQPCAGHVRFGGVHDEIDTLRVVDDLDWPSTVSDTCTVSIHR